MGGKALWLLLAFAACVAGFGWLALAMDSHWQQVRRGAELSPGWVRRLRVAGVLGLALALAACLKADHATMASLVWIMTLAAAALAVAFTLSWRPHWLAPLALWIPPQPPAAGGSLNVSTDDPT